MGLAIPFPIGQVYDTATPTAGQTVAMSDDARDGILFLTPTGPLATLTIQLPSDAKSRLCQARNVVCSKAVTILTVTGAGTIYNAPASLAAGAAFTIVKTAANTWAFI